MKRSLLLSALAMGLVACGGKDDDTGQTGITGATSATTNSTMGTDSSDTNMSDSATATATATDSGTDSATSGGESSGAVFIEDPDGGAGANECDIWAQDCSDGEKCMPWANDGGSSWNATKCSPLNPDPKQPGDPCTVEGNGVSGIDDCDVSAMCWNVDPETNMGYCVDFCKGSEAMPTCDNPATSCVIANNGVLILCLPNCDPLLQDCDNMDVCIPAPGSEGFVCVLDASGDGGAYGDPCEYANVCDPGLFCANAGLVPGCQGSLGCCSQFCDVTKNDNTQCLGNAQGQECVAYYEAGQAPPGYDDVGVCIIPM